VQIHSICSSRSFFHLLDPLLEDFLHVLHQALEASQTNTPRVVPAVHRAWLYWLYKLDLAMLDSLFEDHIPQSRASTYSLI
jgi:hypothetical protein